MESCWVEEEEEEEEEAAVFLTSTAEEEEPNTWGLTSAMVMVGGVSLFMFFSPWNTHKHVCVTQHGGDY